ncbi:MAG TPA: hypothetical protein VH853_09845 [Polyangia bacterium]|nr:hypothetical protein [Polyangia bacterium]
MSLPRWAGWLMVLWAATTGCSKLNSGRCDQKSDCQSNEMCDSSTKKCFAMDGGAAGSGGMGGAGAAAGSPGGAGGAPFICPNSKCKSDSNTPICDQDAGTCRGCDNVESTTACRSLDAGTNACVSAADAGTRLGMCVACVSNKDCSGDKPVCDSTSNSCVGCLANSDCAGTASPPSATPICELTGTSTVPLDTCRSCSKDAECGGPGICMADGHCAKDTEVIFVDEAATNCSSANGLSSNPYCSLPVGAAALTQGQNVLIILGTTGERLTLATPGINPVIVGRGAVIPAANGAAISVSSDTVLIRDLTVSGGTSNNTKGFLVTGSAKVTLLRVTSNLTTGLGIDAETGTTLMMDECYLLNNSLGGVVVNGAIAKIQNTVIAGASTAGTGIQFNAPGAGTQFLFNTVVGYPIAATSDPSDSVPLVDSIVVGPVQNCTVDTSITTQPTFSTSDPKPYHLTTHLACPKAVTSYPDHDVDGQPRTPPIDCGADEYVPMTDGGQ